LKGNLLLISAGLLYGTIPILATLLGRCGISTVEQMVIRLGLAVIIMAVGLAALGRRFFIFRNNDIIHIVLFGLFFIAVFFSMYMSAAVLTSTAVAVLLLYIQPAITPFLARLVLKEKIEPRSLAAVVLALAGVVFILRVWDFDWGGFSFGHILGFLSGVFYAVYIIYMRILVAVKKYDLSLVTFWTFVSGLVWMIPLWFVLDWLIPQPAITAVNLSPSTDAWLLLVAFAVIPTILGYLAFNGGLKYVSSQRAGVLIIVEPVGAVIMGALILGQAIGFGEIVGGLLILSSVAVVSTGK